MVSTMRCPIIELNGQANVKFTIVMIFLPITSLRLSSIDVYIAVVMLCTFLVSSQIQVLNEPYVKHTMRYFDELKTCGRLYGN